MLTIGLTIGIVKHMHEGVKSSCSAVALYIGSTCISLSYGTGIPRWC